MTDALTGPGNWAPRGGILRWTGPRPADDPAYTEPIRRDRVVGFDEVKVYLAVTGHPVHRLNKAERHAAIRQLHAKGLNDSQIARRIGSAHESVQRTRKNVLHLPPNTGADQEWAMAA